MTGAQTITKGKLFFLCFALHVCVCVFSTPHVYSVMTSCAVRPLSPNERKRKKAHKGTSLGHPYADVVFCIDFHKVLRAHVFDLNLEDLRIGVPTGVFHEGDLQESRSAAPDFRFL